MRGARGWERYLYRCKASSITPSEMRVWRCTPFKSSLEKSVSKKRRTFCDRRVQVAYKSSSGSSDGAGAGAEACGSCPASTFCKGDVELVVTAATVAMPPELVLFSMMPLLIPATVAFFLIVCAVVVVVVVVAAVVMV